MPEPAATTDTEVSAEVPESDLVRRAREGDLTAYDDLVKRYQERRFTT